jgi:uncharacterized protein (DUF2062 family)
MHMLDKYFRKRLKEPVMALLGKGISPEKLALSLGLGITLGIFPILGTTSILCLIFALAFRLNVPAIMAANWAVYPLQIAFLAPFFVAGRHLFGSVVILDGAHRLAPLSTTGLIHGAGLLAQGSLHAVLAWCAAAPFCLLILTLSLLPVLRKFAHRG